MPAETLNCPMCGAPASTDATSCTHCGARLATVSCPKCFGMMFIGEKFCSHCGAKAERAEEAVVKERLCPRCHVNMDAVSIGKAHVRECPKCEGVWLDTETLHVICEDREEQTAVLGIASHLPAAAPDLAPIRYIPCPVCKDLMNRVNFANCSNVIVDVCREHGTWFDCNELRQIVEFIQAGGMSKARAKEIADLQAERRETAWQGASLGAGSGLGGGGTSGWGDSEFVWWKIGIEAAAVLLRIFLR